ncbi:MAG: hypothetical protein AW11_03953 [Candidatus Accumulibacter regalis]|uniref:Uncharacterized protein n=1 Tax=Accumulibacter regalis TaxID=522306 RepID=A0A011P9F6_ACCRE|nr:MAG: hypothetical protein AW11_03953 [Candidatus Accumulibacter regalis]
MQEPARQVLRNQPQRQNEQRQDQQGPGQQTAQAAPATPVRGALERVGHGAEADQRMPAPRLAEQSIEPGSGERSERQKERGRHLIGEEC